MLKHEYLLIARGSKNDHSTVFAVFYSVLIFSATAHLYRYVNSAFNSDSLGIFRGGADMLSQIGRGRWLQPVYLYVRGMISAPFLIGLMAALYLSLSILLMVKTLEITNRKSIVAICGLLSVAPAITISNASFVPWTDVFMLSLFFSMVSAYCMTAASVKHRYLIAIVFLILSLALYQAYVDACMLVCLYWLLRRSILGEDSRSVIKSAAIMALIFVVSFVLYYGSFWLACSVFSVEASQKYNSVASATILSGDFRLFSLIRQEYKIVFRNIIRPKTFHSTIAGCIHALLLLVSAVLLFPSVREKKTWRIVMILLLVMLCPLASYFIYLLFGNESDLLVFPLSMLCLGVGMLFELVPSGFNERLKKMLFKTSYFFAGVLIFFGIVYSNQLYVKKDVEEQETLSLMTRVLYRMEETEGYVPGRTRVALIGSLQDSDACVKKPGYASGGTADYEISIAYYNNYRMYLTNIMGYPINLVDLNEAEKIGLQQTVMDMPAFPYPGCTMMVGETLVVKLSDTNNPIT